MSTADTLTLQQLGVQQTFSVESLVENILDSVVSVTAAPCSYRAKAATNNPRTRGRGYVPTKLRPVKQAAGWPEPLAAAADARRPPGVGTPVLSLQPP